MRKRPLNILGVAFSLLLVSASWSSARAAGPAPATLDELKSDRIKTLAKKDPRFEELLTKARAHADALKGSEPALASRLDKALDQIVLTAAGFSEKRFRADMEILEAISKAPSPPKAADLAPLQERYTKLCSQFEDMVFNKDLDRAFHIHDKFVRYTSLGLWDKDKIGSELERMEGLVERAPDIAFGKAELFDTCKNKRLTSIPKLVYLGAAPKEEYYLTNDRRLAAVIDEGCGQPLNMELSERIIQSPDGKLINFDQCNDPLLGFPFSPPLSLWAKTRMQEGRVPAILLRLVDTRVKAEYPDFASKSNFIGIADVLDGKLDDYMKTNIKLIGPEKSPVLLGLFTEFDREAAATAFGADGKTPYYFVLDPKLKDMPEDKRNQEVKKRIEKGVYSGGKAAAAELCNQYGEQSIPDGPERVRDAWKRLVKISNDNGSGSAAFFSAAGSFHANKKADKFSSEEGAGNQVWNKLEYYWPGEKVLDWVGIEAIGSDPDLDPKGANIMEALEPFMAEVRSSNWQATPVMLVNAAPSREAQPFTEAAWINSVFGRIIPATFPNILAAFVSVPGKISLWTGDAKTAFRTNISSNKFFNYKLRFKPVVQESKDSQTADGGN